MELKEAQDIIIAYAICKGNSEFTCVDCPIVNFDDKYPEEYCDDIPRNYLNEALKAVLSNNKKGE